MRLLTGYDLYDYITAGAQKIISAEETLNAINVFPVADGDTGSNLAYTMKCIIAGADRYEHVGDTLKSISSVALEDAYGNSGTIFASYLYGLSEEVKSKDLLSVEEFSQAAKRAVQYAYDALAKPTEGTILTVINDWADYLNAHHKGSNNFSQLMTEAIENTKVALKNTKHQLKVLTDADVVDAGALGFVYFLEGILEFIKGGVVTLLTTQEPKKALLHQPSLGTRYCTEFIVSPFDHFDKQGIVEALSANDDSIIVQKIGDYYKIHTHTNHPEIASDLLIQHGQIIKSKVDDMAFQVSLNQKDRRKIGIITDSIADLPDFMLRSTLINRIPLMLNLNGNMYTDRLTLNNAHLFEKMDATKTVATSAQPGDTLIEKNIKLMLNHYDHVIGIFVSSEMSGMYQKVANVVQKMKNDRITLIDSKTNSVTQGLLVHSAYEMIESGQSLDTIITALKATLNHYTIYVQIPDLHYATLSGRVPKIVGTIAGLLKMKAIISIDDSGKGIVTRERSFKAIVERFAKNSRVKKYALVYTGDLKDHETDIRMIENLMGIPPVFVEEVSGVVSAFIGKGAIGIGVFEN